MRLRVNGGTLGEKGQGRGDSREGADGVLSFDTAAVLTVNSDPVGTVGNIGDDCVEMQPWIIRR